MDTENNQNQAFVERHTTLVWSWFKQKMCTRHAQTWLALYAFFESVILPVPTDIFLALMVLANKRKVVWLTILTIGASLLGAATLYFITIFFDQFIFQSLVTTFGFEGDIVHASEALRSIAFLAILVAAFTPIPYTPAIIAAGLLHVDFFVFFAASLLGRGVRYTLVSLLVYTFGVSVLAKIEKKSALVTLSIVGAAFVLWFGYRLFT